MKKQISTLWGVIIIVISAVVLFGGVFAYQYFAKQNFAVVSPLQTQAQNGQSAVSDNQQVFDNQVMCTMDAMQCPDGSYVGRTGPNCEFEECSEMKTDEIVKTKEQSCINSGGKVIMENCNCPDNVTPADFYNHCNMALNTCFCDPSLGIKKQLKTCDCGLNKCWNGTECSTIEK